MTKEKLKNAKSNDGHLDVKTGSKFKTDVGFESPEIAVRELLKKARREAKLTQQQLAEKSGTYTNLICRLERGTCEFSLSDIYRIFGTGLGKKVSVLIS